MYSNLDYVSELERRRDTVKGYLHHGQIALNVISITDVMMEHTWKERGRMLGEWADEAERNINKLIDAELTRG